MKTTRTALIGSILAGSALLVASHASAQTPVRNTIEGEVTKVDAKRGWVDVKTSEGSMKLHFPPSALEGVKKGDSMTVEMGLTSQGPAPRK